MTTGAGSDTVTILALTADSANLDAGDAGAAGVDMVNVGTSSVAVSITHGLTIATGDGDDVITLDNLTTADSVSINAGGATNIDTVTVGDLATVTVTGDLDITTDTGADSVSVNQTTVGALNVDTGDAADTITVLTLVPAVSTSTRGMLALETPIR